MYIENFWGGRGSFKYYHGYIEGVWGYKGPKNVLHSMWLIPNKIILYKLRIRITHSQYQMLQIIELVILNEALEWWGQTERNFINYNYFFCCLTNRINAIMSPLKTVDDQNKNVV